ncbi:MAG: YhcH/YjgK/YiaL family protein [Eubacteriales bacterium]
MIYDKLANASLYAGMGPELREALQVLQNINVNSYVTGKVIVDGDRLFYMCNAYETRAKEDALMEAHQQYIDLMYMVAGEEIIYVKPTDELDQITNPYDEAADALLAAIDADATALRLQKGQFVILYPQDAHCPMCETDKPEAVQKIVMKLRIK